MLDAPRHLAMIVALLVCSLVFSACGQANPSAPGRSDQAAGQTAATRTSGPRGVLKMAYPTEPETLNAKFGSGSGLNEFNWIFNSFLTYYDFQGSQHPLLAREIPTQQNGGWVINPDGSMVTTYKLREHARWHDGAPLTAGDFEFAFEVYLDRDQPVRDRHPENLMASVEAPDPQTLVVNWKQPYVYANTLGYQQLDPLPRHILEEKYRSNRGSFTIGEEWTTSYVGTGPFRIDRWVPGAGLMARANPQWVLGAPKLELLDIRFISDPNTQLANLLSGELDIVTSPGIRGNEAVVAKEQWVDRGQGYLKTWAVRSRYLEFQFREVPNWQRAVTDLRVRQALMHAIDRQALSDAATDGLGNVSDVFMSPSEAIFPEVDRAIFKYPFDPNRATALLGEAGWRRGSTGGMLTNASGLTLDVDVWNTAGGNSEREGAVIADAWKNVGINSSLNIIPSARQRDNEYRVSFPATAVSSRSMTPDNFVFTSAHVPTAEARWQGPNRGSFRDPEVDRLQNLALTSLDPNERKQATIAVHRRITEVLGIGPLYSDVEVILAKHKVKGPVGNYVNQQGATWNVFEWEITE